MDKEVKDTSNAIKRWSLGGLLALGAVLVILIVRIENIPVLERRLDKKIEQLNEHAKALNQHEIDFLTYQLREANKEIERIKEMHKLEIEIEIIKAKQ